MTEQQDEQRLTEILRDGLRQLSTEVDVTVPVAERARAAVVRRRRRSLLLAGAATAAVATLVVAAMAVTHGADRSRPLGPTATASDAPTAPEVPGGYRLESWHSVEVYVPASWGWGGAPPACGVGPRLGSDGHRLVSGETVPGYVGRPVAQVRHCSQRSQGTQPTPTAPYVWLGASLAPGRVDLGDGWVQETRMVAGVTVTVAGDDADLRAAILRSAHPTSTGCDTRLAAPPTPGGSAEDGTFAPGSMLVCAYAADESAAHYDLLYAESLPAGAAKELADAVVAAKPLGEFSCYGARGGEWALLHLTQGWAPDAAFRDYVVDLSCPSIAAPDGTQHELTTADVLPWAVDGVNAVLHAPPQVALPGRLIELTR